MVNLLWQRHLQNLAQFMCLTLRTQRQTRAQKIAHNYDRDQQQVHVPQLPVAADICCKPGVPQLKKLAQRTASSHISYITHMANVLINNHVFPDVCKLPSSGAASEFITTQICNLPFHVGILFENQIWYSIPGLDHMTPVLLQPQKFMCPHCYH